MLESRDGRRRTVFALATIGVVALVAGCAGGDSLSRDAERTFRDAAAEDPSYGTYGVTVAARGSSAFARSVVQEALAADDQRLLEAVRAVAPEPSEDMRAALEAIYGGRQGALKLLAGSALARLGDAAAVEWLKEQTDTVGGQAQLEVVATLARLGEREAAEQWIRRNMDSDSQQDRDSAYAVLGIIGEEWSRDLLLEGLDHEHGEGRRQAIESLGRSGDASVAPELRPFINTQGLVFATVEALGALGDAESRGALEQLVDNDAPLMRVYAAAALWRIGALDDPEAVLGPLAGDGDARVRATLAGQLEAIDDPRAGAMLQAMAADADPEVRAAVVRALDARGGSDAVPALLGLTGDDDYVVATSAIDALGRLASADAAGELEGLLDSSNPYVRISAACAILEIKSRGA
jgi:HEAT repeat protein